MPPRSKPLADPSRTELGRVAYVLKCYPRYSETFVVNEILAHEAADLPIEIFSLRPPTDGYFQDAIARVRASVSYLPAYGVKSEDFWTALQDAGAELPGLWGALDLARGADARDVYQALLLANEVRRRGVCHLHAHFATVATTVTRLAARFANVPYTFTAHAKDIFHETTRVDDLQRKLRDAAAVVTVSNYNVAYLHESCGRDVGVVRRIYNGLDLTRFAYDPPRERGRHVVAVGRLVEKKGFGDLVAACAILVERGCQFVCQIVGTGPLEPELRAQIEALGLQAVVELVGPRPQAEVVELVRRGAVLAAPCTVGRDSNRDGLPTVLLEAMAVGTPCVSTDVTGIPEVVRDGETGLMVPPGDRAALAVALERLLDDPDLRVALAARARRLIETSFDVHRNTAVLRRIFQAAVRTRSAAA
ncbi:MAG: glycosyltransferase [Chloroflexi bacterium]|nr:glycosyltransferase [Chloroflexota bacterium]